MRIIEKEKTATLQESMGVRGYKISGNQTLITIDEMDMDFVYDEIRKMFGRKCTKISDDVIAVKNDALIDFAISNLG